MRWMFALAVLISLAVLTSRPVGYSAPIKGAVTNVLEIPAAGMTTTERFRGGERACVQVAVQTAAGDREASTTVEITVHDENGKKIAEDTGRGGSSDVAAVFWYPPRDGDYKITIRNLESRKQRYFVFIR